MFERAFIFEVVLLTLASLLAAAHAAPFEPEEKPDVCIAKIEDSGLLGKITIPREVGDFVSELRARQIPQLKNFNLIKFANSGLIPELPKASDGLIEACAIYAGNVLRKTQAVCDLDHFANDYDQFSDYLEEASKHPDFVNKVGHAKVCLLLCGFD